MNIKACENCARTHDRNGNLLEMARGGAYAWLCPSCQLHEALKENAAGGRGASARHAYNVAGLEGYMKRRGERKMRSAGGLVL